MMRVKSLPVRFLIISSLLGSAPLLFSQEPLQYDNDFCLTCHEDNSLETSDGRKVGTDKKVLDNSVHKGVSCFDCHQQPGADFEDAPHFRNYQKVDCQKCHSREATVFMEYFYKMLEKKGTKNIPDCKDCHGEHNAKTQLDMKNVCEKCHQDVARDYSESFHFRKYKEDTRHYPICTTCHDPHMKGKKEAMSDIEYKQEIVDICSKCHQKDIETYVHSRHFHELESGNPKAPVCTSCHEKHKIKKPADGDAKVSPLNISNVCNTCHPGHKESLHGNKSGQPSAVSCATCHTGHQTDMASINQAIFKEGGIFNRCNYCHSSERHAKESLAHGEMMMLDDKGQPANCTKCHIYHANMPAADSSNIQHITPECTNCHAQQFREYTKSIHGKARAAGIVEAPTCVTCHGKNDIKKVKDQFTAEGIVELCSSCHSNKDLMLKLQINPYVAEGYKDTYHGKIMEMGSKNLKFAVCSNCHGSHSILPPDDPQSSVNRTHIVETCKQCHPRANENFVSYLAHPKKPTETELEFGRKLASKDKSIDIALRLRGLEPEYLQRYTKINHFITGMMTLLLFSVLGVFGFHTILWFQRGIRGRLIVKGTYYRRFDNIHIFLHILINISFLTLAFTGLPQSYAHTELAKWMFKNVMPLETAQNLHYIAAAVTGFYFLTHLIFLTLKLKKIGLKKMFTGPDTLMPRWKDFTDFWAHLKWFLKKGPAPKFDRWTYWEKFDYFAVFWGVLVIGLSGLLRWQEEFFGNLLGGGVITLADTIHKEEALLATAFIFIVHFFNTHLRAEKFPMDISIYSGRISEKDFKEERSLQWERMQNSGELEAIKTKPMSALMHIISYFWGIIALSTGIFLLVLILIGQFTAK